MFYYTELLILINTPQFSRLFLPNLDLFLFFLYISFISTIIKHKASVSESCLRKSLEEIREIDVRTKKLHLEASVH